MEIISREEAIKIGQKWFFTGIECKNGHVDKISVSRWMCYQCSRDYKKQKREENPEIERKYRRDSYKRNSVKINQKAKEKYPLLKEERQKYLKEYYLKNKDKLLEKAKSYFNENREKIKQYKACWSKTESGIINKKKSKANRREREKSGTITTNDVKSLLAKNNKCYWCGIKIDIKTSKSYHLDHYVPLAKGGTNTIENIVLSCCKCNLLKKAKDPIEFANSIGKLL